MKTLPDSARPTFRDLLPRTIGLLIVAALLGALNNLFNPERAGWIGSPPVLPKPADWPDSPLWEGLLAGLGVARDTLFNNSVGVAAALLVLALGMTFLRRREGGARRFALSWWRLLLGLLFLSAAWPKLMNPSGFAMAVAQYQVLPAFIVNPFSIWLPALELVTGLLLLFSRWERESAILLGLMMTMFIIALSQAIVRQLGIACGCFDIHGASDSGQTWYALLRDVVLMIPILWMYRKGEYRFLWKF